MKAWEGTQAQGGPMEQDWGSYFWLAQLKDLSFFPLHRTRVVKCHDSADSG